MAKICHITTVHTRYDIRIYCKECISVAKSGHTVFLVVQDNQTNEEIDGIKIVSINNKTINNRFVRILNNIFSNKIYASVKSLNADIYQIHDPELLVLGVKLRKQGFRVVYDSHEDVPRQILAKEWIPYFLRRIISIIFEKYENRCAKMFDAIVVPTAHIYDRFKQVNSCVWEVCNYPTKNDIFYSSFSYSNRNPGCYIGDLTITRGIRQIAEATNRAGIDLNICGEFFSTNFKKEILDKFKNVNYLGVLKRAEIFEILRNSSMGFVTLLDTPNDATSYPIKLFEYMAAGIPVVASNFAVYRKIVEGNNCGICVDPLDISAISNAIIDIINDESYANHLRINGFHAVINEYNWNTQAAKLLKCYNSILKYHLKSTEDNL